MILSSLTYNYIQKRKKRQATMPPQESLGRGDEIFKKAGGKKFYFGEAFAIFMLIGFLRVALYYPVAVHVRDIAFGRHGDIVKSDFVDNAQTQIVAFGSYGFTLLFPIWLPLSVGINLWNQLDEDFPNKKLIHLHQKRCEKEGNFDSCGIFMNLRYSEEPPKVFEEAAFGLRKFMTDDSQVCDIYGFIMHNYGIKRMRNEATLTEREMCELEICQPRCKYLHLR